MVQFAEIGTTNGAPTTYLALSAVLVFLVLLTFWREMSSGSQSQFFTRSFAALSFVILYVGVKTSGMFFPDWQIQHLALPLAFSRPLMLIVFSLSSYVRLPPCST